MVFCIRQGCSEYIISMGASAAHVTVPIIPPVLYALY